jgi:hypothetical protein
MLGGGVDYSDIHFEAVLRIRIRIRTRRIRMILGLPDPDPFVSDMELWITKQK